MPHPSNLRQMLSACLFSQSELLQAPASPSIIALANAVAIVERFVLKENTCFLDFNDHEQKWQWRIALNEKHAEELAYAVHTFVDTTNYFGIWGPEYAFDAAYSTVVQTAHPILESLPIPGTVASFNNPTDVEKLWGERTWWRSQANGAQFVITLCPPEEDGKEWVARSSIELDGQFYNVSKLQDYNTPTEWDEDTLYHIQQLAKIEVTAAKLVGNVPNLFTKGESELTAKRLDLFCQLVSPWQKAGLLVKMPKGTFAKAVLATKVSITGSPSGMLSGGLLLNVDVDMDGRKLTAADIDTLANAKGSMVRLGDQWVRVPDNIKSAQMLVKKEQSKDLTAAELLDEEFDDVDLNLDEVTGWVGNALRGIPPLSQATPIEVPKQLKGQLRPYQKDGLTWLNWCEQNNVGGILADSMGLGKTVQLLAQIQNDHSGPTLVICPTTLIDNWEKEATKFTPELSVGIFHGPTRNLEELKGCDIILSTYALLGLDKNIYQTPWHRVILDEAQAIKNPSTKAAQGARKLQTTHRFIVTGTPIENHLGDLWSLLSFAQPGLLGSFAKFKRRYVTSSDENKVLRLRRLIAPFVLRRSKTDKKVISDLPDKIEKKHYCSLSREQIGMYEATVRAITKSTVGQDDMKRRSLILAGLTKLKQTCVHPALAQGNYQLGIHSPSGKLEELIHIITSAQEENEAVIVFTQFASFLPPLAQYLKEHAKVNCLILDGSMTRAKRSKVVEQFADPNGPPVLLASLKAGGTGLNLVRANHVVHLDRWWNPAVEDQGSDRAWRIGQVKNVLVHTLVVTGTLEEKIDDLLKRKRSDAAEIIDGQQVSKAVTEMSNKELKELIQFAKSEHDHMQKVIKNKRGQT